MMKQQRPVFAAILGLVGLCVACTTDNASDKNPGTGGVFSGTGGAIAGGASGVVTASGGAYITGGTTSTSASTTGGAGPATGGTTSTSSSATGGTSPSIGGTTGSTKASGGTSTGSGGIVGVGGSGPAAGGNVGAGGAGTGGAGTGGTRAIDPAVSAAINTCMDKLPYGGRDMSADKRAPIVKAIINSCAEFAPPGAEWQAYCQMFLVAAINAESSYDTMAGAQGAGNDPSVGLLQIRFSSVVRDIADFGPIDTLARIGCDFGTVTSSDSYATKRDMMLDVTCNIAIATWYYFIFGSGNGGSSVVWVYQYCAGGGVAGNLHIGLASFLMGGDAAHTSLSGADFYYNEIKTWSEPCMTYSGTHPFERTIQPDTKKYCK